MRDDNVSPTRIEAAVRARQEADRLLHCLLHDRVAIEHRSAEAGRVDPLKELTGNSAMDRAIESTRAMIEEVDAFLADTLEPSTAAS